VEWVYSRRRRLAGEVFPSPRNEVAAWGEAVLSADVEMSFHPVALTVTSGETLTAAAADLMAAAVVSKAAAVDLMVAAVVSKAVAVASKAAAVVSKGAVGVSKAAAVVSKAAAVVSKGAVAGSKSAAVVSMAAVAVLKLVAETLMVIEAVAGWTTAAAVLKGDAEILTTMEAVAVLMEEITEAVLRAATTEEVSTALGAAAALMVDVGFGEVEFAGVSIMETGDRGIEAAAAETGEDGDKSSRGNNQQEQQLQLPPLYI